jgi:hypothetical protein
LGRFRPRVFYIVREAGVTMERYPIVPLFAPI